MPDGNYPGPPKPASTYTSPPVVERRRVVIEYEIMVPNGPVSLSQPVHGPSESPSCDEMAEMIERCMTRRLERSGRLFNGAVKV